MFTPTRGISALPLILLALTTWACSGQQRTQPGTTPPAPSEVTPDTQRAMAPMTLKLEARQLQPDGALVELTATLTINGGLPGPPVLRIQLPQGATLSDGEPEETLELPGQAGTPVKRIFQLAGVGQGEVEVSAESSGQGAGARAVAYYPRRAPAPVKPVEKRAIPSTKIKGETVDRAVPIN